MQEQEPACADRIRCEVTERFKKSGALYVETVAIDIWYVAEGCPQAVSIMNLAIWSIAVIQNQEIS
jgi:hypothetical protein